MWEPSGPVAEGANGKSDESTNSHNERLKRCVDITSRSLLLGGANLITHCLFPAPSSGNLLSARLHSQLWEYSNLWDAKNMFHVLEQTARDKNLLSSQLCSEQDVQGACSTAYFTELGLIQNFGWFKVCSQLGLVTNIVPRLCRFTAYGCDRLNGVSPQLA